MTTWNRWTAGAVLLLGLGCFPGCSDDESPPPTSPCPTINDPGPIASSGSYLFVANSLGETWQAIDLDQQPPVPLTTEGTTGQYPNDLDLVADFLYITNSGDNTVLCFDLDTGLPIGCIQTGNNTNPWALFPDPSLANTGWVTCFLSGELLEVNLQTLAVTRRLTVGSGIEGVWASDSVVVVTLTGFNGTINDYEDGSVVVYEKSNLDELARLAVPPNAQVVFEGADDRVHVVCTGNYNDVSGQVVRIEPSSWTVLDTLALGGAPGYAVLAPSGDAYLAGYSGGLMSYDTTTFQALNDSQNPILNEIGLGGLAISGGVLYVTNFDADAVRMVQLSDDSDLGSVNVGDGPIALAGTP